jgi:hypothetical protein
MSQQSTNLLDFSERLVSFAAGNNTIVCSHLQEIGIVYNLSHDQRDLYYRLLQRAAEGTDEMIHWSSSDAGYGFNLIHKTHMLLRELVGHN